MSDRCFVSEAQNSTSRRLDLGVRTKASAKLGNAFDLRLRGAAFLGSNGDSERAEQGGRGCSEGPRN